MVAIVANVRFYHYHYTVFTESLYSSILILIMAVRYATLALLSILCGIAVTVRTSAIFLLPAMLIGLMLVWNRSKISHYQLIIICITPFLILLAAEKIVHSAWHDNRSASLFTRHAFAKAALIDAPAAKSENVYQSALQDKFKPARDFI